MSLHALMSLHASVLFCSTEIKIGIPMLWGFQKTQPLLTCLWKIPSFEGHLRFLVQVLHRCVSRQLHNRYVRLRGDCSAQKGIEASGNYAVHPCVHVHGSQKRLDVWESLRAAGEHISHARLLRFIGKPSNPEERPPWPGALPLRKIDRLVQACATEYQEAVRMPREQGRLVLCDRL